MNVVYAKLISTSCFLIGLCFTASIFADETITTSSGTFVLKPSDPSQLLGEAALKSALRTTELAMAAVAADAKKLEGQQKALDGDIESFNTKQQNAVNEAAAKAEAFKGKAQSYNNEVQQQQAEVAQHNSIAPESRSQSNADRLNAWGGRLESRKAALQNEQQGLTNWAAQKESALQHDYDDLAERQQKLNFNQGTAYRQLQLCYNYAQQVNSILAEKYKISSSTNTSTWNDAGERLKELSNKGFDGNVDQGPLQQQGQGTEFFRGAKVDRAGRDRKIGSTERTRSLSDLAGKSEAPALLSPQATPEGKK